MSQNVLFPSALQLLDIGKSKEVLEKSHEKHILDGNEFTSFPKSGENNSSSNSSTSTFLNIEKTGSDIKGRYQRSKRKVENSSSDWESGDSSDQRKKNKKKDKKKHKKSRKKNSHRAEKYKEPIKKPDTIWLDATSLDFAQAFRKDCRPDQSNADFGGLYKMDIALYKPHLNWICLGLSRSQKCELYMKKKKNRKKSKRKENLRYYDSSKDNLIKDSQDDTNRFVNIAESSNFIPLVGISKKETVGQEIVEGDSHLSSAYLDGNRKFSRELLDAPNNIQLWLEFVDYQNLLAIEESTSAFVKSFKTPKAIVEKKISILEKAMIKNPTSLELILKYANLIREIWPSEKVQEKWKEWLFKFPNLEILWHEYLLYMQSNLLMIKVSTVLECFRKCFRMLVGIYEGRIRSHEASTHSDEELLTIFLHMVVFLWQAGHVEKAVCLLQCMVEYNIFSPEKFLKDDFKDKKREVFEGYFENNVPRFSEEHSIGWKFWAMGGWAGKKLIIPSTVILSENFHAVDFDETLTLCKQNNEMSQTQAWFDLERVRECSEISPFFGDEANCEDTERIILFDDISFALFDLPSMELHLQLILAYLLFLGVSVKRSLISSSLQTIFSKFFCFKDLNEVEFSCPCHPYLLCEFVTVETNISRSGYRYSPYIVSKVRQILSQTINILKGKPFSALSEIWLHFEMEFIWWQIHKDNRTFEKAQLKAIHKFIKCVMKPEENRNSIGLWNMYACYEWKMGNVENSQKIFVTALSLIDNDDEIKKVYMMSTTIRSMIDLALDIHSNKASSGFVTMDAKDKILNILLLFLNSSNYNLNDAPNQVSLLHLSLLLNNCFAILNQIEEKYSLDVILVQSFLCCFVTFQYFCNGTQALINTFEDLFGVCKKSPLFSETCVYPLIYCLIIMKGLSRRDFAFFPYYRKSVEKCLQSYPCDSYMNFSYLEIKKNGLDSLSVRRTYECLLKSTHHVNPWLFAISYEEQRLKAITVIPVDTKLTSIQFMDSKTGVHNRICSLYQRMLDKEEFRYSTDLWVRFIEFQLKYGNLKLAKETFYTALRCCPTSKEIYMLACKHLNNFPEVYDLMIEKEVRVKLVKEELELLWNN